MRTLLLALLLLLPSTTFAAPTTWDYAAGTLQPLQSMWSALVKGSYFQSTSTSAINRFPNALFTNASSTNATTTALDVTGLLTFDGVTGNQWSDFCTTITGSADLCDGSDDGGGGGFATTSADYWLTEKTTDDLAEGASQYFTSERSQDAVGNILVDSSRIDFTYNDAGNIISADILADSIADEFIDFTDLTLADFTNDAGFITAAVTAIGAAGQTSDGPTVTFATSSSATNGLTPSLVITGSGDTQTFTSSISGTLTVAGGGTGATTLTGVLKGNGTGAFTAGVDGTDFTLTDAITCTNQAITAVTAAGVSTCSSINNAFWSGTDLSVANGGTGVSTFTSSQLLYGNGTNALTSVATTSLSLGLGLSHSGTLGAFVGGSAGTLNIATSSLYTGSTGQFPYFSGTNALVGTSTISVSTASNVTIGTTTAVATFNASTGSTTVLKLDKTSTATSTFAGGVNLTGGCYAISNNCVGGSSATSLTQIPFPVIPSITGAGTQTTLNTNTTQTLYQFNLPYAITVNKITMKTGGTVTTAGTWDITIYSENGQTQEIAVTTASVSTGDTLITTAVSAVTLQAGVHWFAINPNGTADAQWYMYTQGANAALGTTAGLPFDIASEPVLAGTLTITAGTPAATFDPTAVSQAVLSSTGVVFRLDN